MQFSTANAKWSIEVSKVICRKTRTTEVPRSKNLRISILITGDLPSRYPQVNFIGCYILQAHVTNTFECTDLPALTFYNPLLNHPSPSEYVASVRSSLCSSAVSSSTNSTPYSKAKTRSIYATESSAAFLTQDNWNRIVLPQHNDPATINEETKRRTSSVQSDVIKSALYKDSLCRKSIVSALIAGLVFLAAAIFLIVFFLGNSDISKFHSISINISVLYN